MPMLSPIRTGGPLPRGLLVSNKVKVREVHGGKLTRPKAQWKGRRRGERRSPLAGAMNAATSAQFNAKVRDQKARFGDMAGQAMGRQFGTLRFAQKRGDLRNQHFVRYTSDTTHL